MKQQEIHEITKTSEDRRHSFEEQTGADWVIPYEAEGLLEAVVIVATELQALRRMTALLLLTLAEDN